MELKYPLELTPDEGTFMVTFPDFGEAVTSGADKADAIRQAADCLEEVIAARIAHREDIPTPSPLHDGQPSVFLSTLTSAKVLLWMEMRRQGMKKADLARVLGWDQKQVDRLFDFHHSSKVEVIDQAMKALGKRMVLELHEYA